MSDALEQLALVLAFLGLAGFFSVYIDVGDVVRAYRDADIVLRVMEAKFQLASMTFTPCRQVLRASAKAPAQGSIGANVRTLIELSADVENGFAQLSRTGAVVLDEEEQILMFASRWEKFKWALGSCRRQLVLKIDKFSELVDMLYRLITTMGPVAITPGSLLSTLDEQQIIWLTDFMGVDRKFHLDMCRGVGGFILTLKSSKESIDADVRAALLNGDFWVVPEEQEHGQLESTPGVNVLELPQDAHQGLILADTWE